LTPRRKSFLQSNKVQETKKEKITTQKKWSFKAEDSRTYKSQEWNGSAEKEYWPGLEEKEKGRRASSDVMGGENEIFEEERCMGKGTALTSYTREKNEENA